MKEKEELYVIRFKSLFLSNIDFDSTMAAMNFISHIEFDYIRMEALTFTQQQAVSIFTKLQEAGFDVYTEVASGEI